MTMYAKDINHIKERLSRMHERDRDYFMNKMKLVAEKKGSYLSTCNSWMVVVVRNNERIASAVGHGNQWDTVLSAGMTCKDSSAVIITA
jgi:hypothetical protein